MSPRDNSKVFKVETEVSTRKYRVPVERLKECLRNHKNISNLEIAQRLNKPVTLVEHWFRNDKCFSVPDADIWFELKELLQIKTNEFDESITTFETRGGSYDFGNRIHAGEITPTLLAGSDKSVYLLENHPNDSRVKISENNIVQTLSSRMGTGGGNCPMVLQDEPTTIKGDSITPTLVSGQYKQSENTQDGLSVMTENKDNTNYIARRLTPLECERLQGYPDNWTNIGEWVDSKGKKHKDADSPRYKALGNSIALPFWEWMAKRMIDVLKKDGIETPTMASLFDGIGGFPLVYSRNGCVPVWASEIEEFPIAVTKRRFGDADN